MPPRAKNPLPMGPARFTYEDVIENLEAYLKTAKVGTKKRLAAACGMDHTAFRHCITQRQGRRFEVEHFGAMAEELDAPIPWPWVPWETADAFKAFLRVMQHANQEHGKHRPGG